MSSQGPGKEDQGRRPGPGPEGTRLSQNSSHRCTQGRVAPTLTQCSISQRIILMNSQCPPLLIHTFHVLLCMCVRVCVCVCVRTCWASLYFSDFKSINIFGLGSSSWCKLSLEHVSAHHHHSFMKNIKISPKSQALYDLRFVPLRGYKICKYAILIYFFNRFWEKENKHLWKVFLTTERYNNKQMTQN